MLTLLSCYVVDEGVVSDDELGGIVLCTKSFNHVGTFLGLVDLLTTGMIRVGIGTWLEELLRIGCVVERSWSECEWEAWGIADFVLEDRVSLTMSWLELFIWVEGASSTKVWVRAALQIYGVSPQS